jgi:hypothetical protein
MISTVKVGHTSIEATDSLNIFFRIKQMVLINKITNTQTAIAVTEL